MPPPPVTPSPHRFVIKEERASRRHHPQEHTPHPHLGTQQQFNTTPRFTVSSTPRPTPSQNLPRATPAPSRYLTPLGKPLKKAADAIESSFEDLESTSSDGHDAHQSIETDEQQLDVGHASTDLEDDGDIEERTPKRRRISTSSAIEEVEAERNHGSQDTEESMSSSLPILSSPPAPRRPIPSTVPRFLAHAPPLPSIPHSISAAVTTSTPTFIKPPRFRAPDVSEQGLEQGDPLPEQFSPHRKGQKYVPGGLASEMRDWLVNIESASTNILPSYGKQKDERWKVKLVVDEVSGDSKTGVTLVRGRQVHDVDVGNVDGMMGGVRFILAGEGAVNGLQRGSKVEVGKILAIQGPVWEVLVEGERWIVSVDWRVLS